MPCLSRRTIWRWIACLMAGMLLAERAIAGAPLLRWRIDREIEGALDAPPAALATDAEFVRRVYLDLTGAISTADAAREFLDDASPYKRQQLVDRLLVSPEFARRMQNVFDVMLMERRRRQYIPADEWEEYLRRSFAVNKPLDQLSREILAGDMDDPAARPAATFYLDRDVEANLLTRDVGRLFFGMDLQCAQCHDHPLVDGYKQQDYYGLYAFLSRSYLFTGKDKQVALAEKAEGDVTFKSVFDSSGTIASAGPHLPTLPAVVEPAFAKGDEYLIPPADKVRPIPRHSRRAALAREITSGANADFNQNLANRLWALVMGRGLVHPVDFRHADNPPSHPDLLVLLADELAAMKFDVRAFLRELLLSETYQRSSELPPDLDPDQAPPERFAVAMLKPLTPEQLAWSLLQVSGQIESSRAANTAQIDADPRLNDLLAADPIRRAQRTELIERAVYSQLSGNIPPFVALFSGGPAGDFQATVHQALFLSNGDLVRKWLSPAGGQLSGRLVRLQDHRALAEELYLSVLSRRPNRVEAEEVAEYLAARPGEKEAVVQELIWALLSSAEFRFNH